MLSNSVFYLVASIHMCDKWSNISVSDKFDVVLVWIFDTIGLWFISEWFSAFFIALIIS